MNIGKWKAMPAEEQFEDWKKWNIYDLKDRKELLDQIVDEFQSLHPNLSIKGWGNIHPELQLLGTGGSILSALSFVVFSIKAKKYAQTHH